MADFRSREENTKWELGSSHSASSRKSDEVSEALEVSLKVLKLPQTWQHPNTGKSDHLNAGVSLKLQRALNPRWWCLKVIRSRWGCKRVEPSWWDQSFLRRKMVERSLHQVRTVRKQASANQEESTHQELNLPSPWPWTSLLPDREIIVAVHATQSSKMTKKKGTFYKTLDYKNDHETHSDTQIKKKKRKKERGKKERS